jgi:hypothetical protein
VDIIIIVAAIFVPKDIIALTIIITAVLLELIPVVVSVTV